jgi:hypothetical protein
MGAIPSSYAKFFSRSYNAVIRVGFGGLRRCRTDNKTIAPRDRTTVRLSDRHSLLNPAIELIAAASTAAFGVFCGLQVTEFACFLRFFCDI